jgi:hypothetical protein
MTDIWEQKRGGVWCEDPPRLSFCLLVPRDGCLIRAQRYRTEVIVGSTRAWSRSSRNDNYRVRLGCL